MTSDDARSGAAPRRNTVAALLLLLGAGLAVAALVVALRPGAGAGSAGAGSADDGADAAPTAWSGDDVDLEGYAADLLAASAAAHSAAGLPAWGPADCARPVAAGRAQALVGAELTHAPLDAVLAACAPLATAAENLSRATAPAPDVVDAWLGSPGHRANVEDPTFTHAAAACVQDGAQVLCSLVLVGP